MSWRRSIAGGQTADYTEGVRLYRNSRYLQAIKRLESLRVRTDSIGRLAKFYRGMSHRAVGMDALQSGRFDLAERHLRAAAQCLGEQSDLASYLAKLYARTNRHTQCLRQMEQAAASRPDSVSTSRRLAQSQWAAGRRAEAYMTLSAAIRRLGGRAELYMQLGLFHAAEGRLAEARTALVRSVEADCTRYDTHRYLGLAAAAQSDHLAAAKSFQRAVQLQPNNVMLAYQLALAAKAAGEQGHQVAVHLPESVATPSGSRVLELARYVTTEHDFIEAMLNLPESEADGELFDLLAGVVRMALAEHPNYPDLHLCCSRILDRLGQGDEAMDYGRKAIQINPNYTQALLHLAELCAQAGREDEAIGLLQRAIANGADWPDVHCRIGELMKHRNAPNDARKHLQRALQLNANYGRAAEAMASLAA
ncbi:MAG: tetratricopeptide repeat protein [Planctomycetota bacterium]|nr:tetratricopeptide repeat protein [Planctomycetota bacterium]